MPRLDSERWDADAVGAYGQRMVDAMANRSRDIATWCRHAATIQAGGIAVVLGITLATDAPAGVGRLSMSAGFWLFGVGCAVLGGLAAFNSAHRWTDYGVELERTMRLLVERMNVLTELDQQEEHDLRRHALIDRYEGLKSDYGKAKSAMKAEFLQAKKSNKVPIWAAGLSGGALCGGLVRAIDVIFAASSY